MDYTDGSTECRRCRFPLEQRPSSDASEWVVVFETTDRVQLAMAKGLLESARIPFLAGGQIATLVQDVDGFLHKQVRLQVPNEHEEEALELLEQLRLPVDPA